MVYEEPKPLDEEIACFKRALYMMNGFVEEEDWDYIMKYLRRVIRSAKKDAAELLEITGDWE